jgi:hypothetical protein
VRAGDETIAADRDRRDEARRVGVIAEGPANFSHGGIDTVGRVDEDAFAPYALEDFLAGN